MRVFTELTPECDKTAQLFAMGYEQKEIADMKCRAKATINAQLHTAMKILDVRNGRELALRYAEKLTGTSLFHITEKARKAISIFLLTVFFIGGLSDHQDNFRRARRTRVRTEVVARRSRD